MSKKIEIQDEAETTPVDDGDDTAEMDRAEQPVETDDSAASPDNDLAAQLVAAQQAAQTNYDRFLRVSADFENYKKRIAREMQDTIKYANEQMIAELLTVVDNLERAIASATKSCAPEDPLVKGVHLTLSETLKILDRHHVSPITAVGEPFDPNFHQAMMQEEGDVHPPNTVVQELQKGYLIHERLLRPALVSVSKASGAKTNNTD